MAPHSHGRFLILVDRPFQLRFALGAAFTGLAVTTLGGGVMYGLVSLVFDALLMPRSERAHVEQLCRSALALVVMVGVVFAFLVFVYVLVATHRIAGPVYAMTRALAEVTRGTYPKLRPLRAHDELIDLHNVLQRALETMRTRELEEAFKMERAVLAFRPLAQSTDAKEALEGLAKMYERKHAAAGREPERDPGA